MNTSPPAIAHPAATVVILRDSETRCEVLLVRRNQQLSFHGGAWVFPGGRIDREDYVAGGEDPIAAARYAAVREAEEEAGLSVAIGDLVLFSRWVTPELSPKRFDTWFFAAPARSGAPVRVDGGEIHAHRWMVPADALTAQRNGEIDLPPPTFVTLSQLTGFQSARAALDHLQRDGLQTFLPRLQTVAGGACCLYPDDVAYDDGDLERPGPRHRLWMLEEGWDYERG